MKFKYSAFTENTAEMREWLEKLGYKRGFFNIPDRGYIKTINSGTYNLTNIIQPLTEYINCLHYDALFQAVTAIRSDSDYMQWFVITRYNEAKDSIVDEWRLCNSGKFNIDSMPYSGIISHHKASLKELQEHFKSR